MDDSVLGMLPLDGVLTAFRSGVDVLLPLCGCVRGDLLLGGAGAIGGCWGLGVTSYSDGGSGSPGRLSQSESLSYESYKKMGCCVNKVLLKYRPFSIHIHSNYLTTFNQINQEIQEHRVTSKLINLRLIISH